MKSKRSTPKNFDGTRSPGVGIDALLPEILRTISRRVDDPREAIFQEWVALVGERLSARARPVSFIEGVLTVLVTGSSFLSILQTYERPRILKEMKRKFQIQDIVFKVG